MNNKTFCPNCEKERETVLYSEVMECTVCRERFEDMSKPESTYWKTQACRSVKHMLEMTSFLRHIMTLGLLRGSPRLTARALEILDGFEALGIEDSTTENVCTWVMLDDPEIDLWCTSCGEKFHLEADTPSDNNMKYCCYCGKAIKES